MKTLKKLCLIAIAIFSVAMIASCDSDSDSNGRLLNGESSSSIVGIWRSDWEEDEYYGYVIISFKSDGTGTYKDYDSDKPYSANDFFKFYYTYKVDIIRIILEDGDETEIWKWEVVSLTSSKLVVIDEDEDDIITFKKVN